MGGRIPFNLTPEQTLWIVAGVAGVVAVVLAIALLELLISRGVALALRLAGRMPPRKSPTRIALDELEERLRRRRSE